MPFGIHRHEDGRAVVEASRLLVGPSERRLGQGSSGIRWRIWNLMAFAISLKVAILTVTLGRDLVCVAFSRP